MKMIYDSFSTKDFADTVQVIMDKAKFDQYVQ